MSPTPSAPLSPAAPTPLWTWVSVGAFEPPAAPARNTAAGAWQALRALFADTPTDDDTPARREAALRAIEEQRLGHLVEAIDWQAALTAFEQAQGDWPDRPGRSRTRVIVGPPHGGHAAMVNAWAARHQARCLTLPTAAQLLGTDAALPVLPTTAWVLPRLEHAYLRHHRGLAWVRALLQQAQDGSAGPGLIGCDSWAWAFWQTAWPGPLPEAWCLQALDAGGLARLLRQLSTLPGPVSFCHARSGESILSWESDDLAELLAQVESPHGVLKTLAAHSRGHPELARLLWRQRLREEPEQPRANSDSDTVTDDAPTTAAPDPGVATAGRDTVWLSPDDGRTGLPSDLDEDMTLLLHALLLHGGLHVERLGDVLPLPSPRAAAVLLRLHGLNLVCRLADGRWQVAPLAYGEVRNALRALGHHTDAL